MVKRHLAGLIVAAVVAGSGAAVAAAPGDKGSRPPKEQVQKCREANQAGQPPSDECKKLREQQQQRPKRQRPGGAALAHAIHGDLIVKGQNGAFEEVAFDKGVVQAKGDRTLTLKRDDGKTVTFKVNDETKYKGVDSFDAVQTGQPAIVVSKDGTARHIGQRAPGGNKPNRGNVKADEEQVPAT